MLRDKFRSAVSDSPALTSWPLPLKRTLSNRVRRAGSPRSEVSLKENVQELIGFNVHT